VPAKIELIKTLIKDEGTIGYEGERNETKPEPVSHCLRMESYLSPHRETGVISKNYSND